MAFELSAHLAHVLSLFLTWSSVTMILIAMVRS